MQKRLTENFTLAEFTKSALAKKHKIDNSLPEKYLPAAIRTAEGLERCRALLKHPIIITSGYRCPELNKLAGGVVNSQHALAQAADIKCPGYGPVPSVALMLASKVKELGIDQLILEFDSWVHVSFTENPRHQLLTIRKDFKKYQHGIIL